MDIAQKVFNLNQLRSARAVALADAEGFHALLHAIELIGQQITGEIATLKRYQAGIANLAAESPLSKEVPNQWMLFHTTFDSLYHELRIARNDAIHQGARARTLANHAIELAIILEDALMPDDPLVAQLMVRDVITAETWHPVSYVRQQMLKHAFSYIPIRHESTWKLISDHSIARYLRAPSMKGERNQRLAMRIDNAVSLGGLKLTVACVVTANTPLADCLSRIAHEPLLLLNGHDDQALVGLLTAADVL